MVESTIGVLKQTQKIIKVCQGHLIKHNEIFLNSLYVVILQNLQAMPELASLVALSLHLIIIKGLANELY